MINRQGACCCCACARVTPATPVTPKKCEVVNWPEASNDPRNVKYLGACAHRSVGGRLNATEVGVSNLWADFDRDRPFRHFFVPAKLKIHELADPWGCIGAGKGQKTKPTARKIATGNPGKRTLNKDEPDFGLVENIDPPEWIQDEARDMWERVVPPLCAQKILQITDLHIVEKFCASYQNWRIAQANLDPNGPVVMSAQGSPIKNAAAIVGTRPVAVICPTPVDVCKATHSGRPWAA